MLLASKNGDISCLGVAFSRQQVPRDARLQSIANLPSLCILLRRASPCRWFSPFSLQEQKVYVQHIIPQHACHLAAAVSSGACIIVCGAAQQMPKAVFAAIVEALSAGSNVSIEDAEEVLKGTHGAVCRRTKHAAHTLRQAWSARSVTCSTHGRKMLKTKVQSNALLQEGILSACHSKSEARMARRTALVIPAHIRVRGEKEAKATLATKRYKRAHLRGTCNARESCRPGKPLCAFLP